MYHVYNQQPNWDKYTNGTAKEAWNNQMFGGPVTNPVMACPEGIPSCIKKNNLTLELMNAKCG